nr:uncharacterized protein LOC119169160 [Rhipicephalus microplus]
MSGVYPVRKERLSGWDRHVCDSRVKWSRTFLEGYNYRIFLKALLFGFAGKLVPKSCIDISTSLPTDTCTKVATVYQLDYGSLPFFVEIRTTAPSTVTTSSQRPIKDRLQSYSFSGYGGPGRGMWSRNPLLCFVQFIDLQMHRPNFCMIYVTTYGLFQVMK